MFLCNMFIQTYLFIHILQRYVDYSQRFQRATQLVWISYGIHLNSLIVILNTNSCFLKFSNNMPRMSNKSNKKLLMKLFWCEPLYTIDWWGISVSPIDDIRYLHQSAINSVRIHRQPPNELLIETKSHTDEYFESLGAKPTYQPYIISIYVLPLRYTFDWQKCLIITYSKVVMVLQTHYYNTDELCALYQNVSCLAHPPSSLTSRLPPK